MLRMLTILIVSIISISATYATPRVSPIEMSHDLASILQGWSQLAMSNSGSSTDTHLISDKYTQDLDIFLAKYSIAFQSLTLRPTIDRSLSYHLRIQQYSLSCEIAALQIILDQVGISVSEKDIFASIPQFPFAYSSGGIWGDPDIEFVGSYTGGQTKRTGYGIYEVPLARYAQTLSLGTEIINESSYSGSMNPMLHMMSLLEKLEQPNTHILLWGDWCTDPQSEDGFFPKGGKSVFRFFPLPARNRCWRSAAERVLIWSTTADREIVGLSGEHAFVLLGYVGRRDHPTHIIVWDTYTGRHVYPYLEWMRKWSLMRYRSLIISQ